MVKTRGLAGGLQVLKKKAKWLRMETGVFEGSQVDGDNGGLQEEEWKSVGDKSGRQMFHPGTRQPTTQGCHMAWAVEWQLRP